MKQTFLRRIRSQLSNVIFFGSVIAITGTGLILGLGGGTLAIGRTSLHEWPNAAKFIFMVTATLGGFSLGLLMSLFASPVILRYAFFARAAGHWKGIPLFLARDEDLPGKSANVFVTGFSFGFGPFRPSIFIAEGARRILSPRALDAVFAHEISHLEAGHLGRRMRTGIGTFTLASIFTAILLIGLRWSGYAESGIFFTLMSGGVPALLTWMGVRRLLWDQEIEADACAIDRHHAAPSDLIEAIQTLQNSFSNANEPHPLVRHRLTLLEARVSASALTAVREAA